MNATDADAQKNLSAAYIFRMCSQLKAHRCSPLLIVTNNTQIGQLVELPEAACSLV